MTVCTVRDKLTVSLAHVMTVGWTAHIYVVCAQQAAGVLPRSLHMED